MIFFEYFSLPKIAFFYDLESEIRCKGTTFFLIMQINCYFFAYGKAKGAKVCLMDLLTTRLGR